MTPDSPRSEDLLQGLRRVHRGALAILAVCAVVIVTQADPADDDGLGEVDRRFTIAALSLGLGSIVARRQAVAPTTAPRMRVPLTIGALLLTSAIGCLGVLLAIQQDQREAALLFVMGGLILALRASPTFLRSVLLRSAA